MTEEQFKWLSNTCDQILLADEATDSTVAIAWLHVIRPHPVIYDKYKNVFSQITVIKKTYSPLLNIIKIVFRKFFYVYLIIKETASSFINKKGKEEKEIDILILSHYVGEQQNNNNDLYYGEIPSILQKAGYSLAIAYIDQSGKIFPKLNEKWFSGNIRHILLSKVLSIRSEVKIEKRLKEEKLRILKMSKEKKCNDGRECFFKNLIMEVKSQESKGALRIGMQIGRIVKKMQPKLLLTTYEGHAWERLVFSESKKANPNIKNMAYQHAPLFKMQHANCRNLKSKFNPDLILASGEISKKKLKNLISLNNIPVELLGSNRANKTGSLSDSRQYGYKECLDKVFLVCPEGIVSECDLIFKFAIECAKINPEISFIFRLHPIVKESMLSIGVLPSNIQFSKNDIYKDFENSTHILYRGSSVVIKAIGFGLQPVYLKIQNEIDINPIFDVDDSILKVVKPIELKSGINNHVFRSEQNFFEISNFCNDFYTNVNDKKITDIFNKNLKY